MTAELTPETAVSPPASETTGACAFEESLSVQQELAETIAYKEEGDRERALGAISLTRKALTLHKQRRDCSDLCNGGPLCPMRDWIMFSRAGAAATWKPDDFVADLSLGAAVTERRSTAGPQSPKTVGFIAASQQQGKSEETK